ncbi:MAG TPA: superoxide dismutase [Burkholderiales bacterium]|jgi:Fe-Mn family superoxide dismutase|nr:superoxide dismutase [Burkholderiales bacterium]
MSTATAKAVQALHFDLPPLPYPEDALAPVISAETLSLHHGKHHRKYVDTMNQLLQKEPVRGATLEDVVRASKGKLFNNAAQAWNHEFYWNSLSPKKLRPSAALARRIDSDFGSQERFADQLAKAAADQFGSGWAWLIEDAGKLAIATTSNADTPMAHGKRCLLTIDVWEHAYYVDYRNQRERYLSGVIGERLNWEFAERNLGL